MSQTARSVPSDATRRGFEIQVSGERGSWTARCYDSTTGEHVWSSEQAATVRTALKEIGHAITRELFNGQA